MADRDPLEFLGNLPKAKTTPRARKPATPRAPRAKGVSAVTLAQPCCPQGHPVASKMKFCPECGSSVIVAGPPRCRNGHEVTASDKFCASCGTPMQGEAAEKIETELELRNKEQRHRMAVAAGKENPAVAYVPGKAPRNADSIVIHFLVDGFGAFGNVWVRGQEIEVWPGHPRWREAQAWITLDAAGQYAKYGRQVFGQGPWPGVQTYKAGIGRFQPLKTVSGEGVVSQPTEEEMERADAAERRRGRRVPMPLG